MLNEAEIEKKLFEQADIFLHHIRSKEYLQAALCREWAGMVALFIGLEDGKMAELFGDRQQETHVAGLINEELYLKACKWCIMKGGFEVSKHTYQNVQILNKKEA